MDATSFGFQTGLKNNKLILYAYFALRILRILMHASRSKNIFGILR
jgi:hypothetical protein